MTIYKHFSLLFSDGPKEDIRSSRSFDYNTRKGIKCLEHVSHSGNGANKAEASREGGGTAGALSRSRAGSAGRTAGSAGDQRAGDGERLGGEDNGGVGDGVAGWGNRAGGDDSGVGLAGGVDDRAGDGVAAGAGRSRGGDWVTAAVVLGAAGRRSDEAVALSTLGDTELGGVLVLASDVVDELESVARGVGLEGGWGSPDVGAGVGDADNDVLERNDVGGGATEENKRDAVGGGWLPGDGEGLAGRDDLVQGTGDGVAAGVANGSMLSRSNSSEESNNGSLGEHVDGGGGELGYYRVGERAIM
jgi:hypothetical protein